MASARPLEAQRFFQTQVMFDSSSADKKFFRLLAALSLGLLLNACSSISPTTQSTTHSATPSIAYYVNCSTGSDSNSGTSSSSPWGTLHKVNSTVFQPGDSILFADGVTCNGTFAPQGQGTSSAPITVSSYGTGSLPVINAGSNSAAVELSDQSFWQIDNISTTGGDPYGIYVTGNNAYAVVEGIQLHNVTVTNVTGTPTTKASGLIIFDLKGRGETFSNILVDGATAYNTPQWAGIYIVGATWGGASGPKGYNITVQNSTVHDVGGDGIVIHNTTNALIQNSVVYNTGQTTVTSVGTPSGIWNYMCTSCTVQSNESYNNHSPDPPHDGGDYDSDAYNTNNIIQYNYGHDADGYCVAVFSDVAPDTNVNTVIRYNICSNDGRNSSGSDQGEIFYSTWDNGEIKNSSVYNNTIYRNPADPNAPAILIKGNFDSSAPNYLANNIVYAVAPFMDNAQFSGPLTLENNLYWFTGTGNPEWIFGNNAYTSLSAWQVATGQDVNSLYADPLLSSPTYHGAGGPTTQFTLQTGSPAVNAGTNVGNMGSQDFFGNALPANGPYNIGAYQ